MVVFATGRAFDDSGRADQELGMLGTGDVSEDDAGVVGAIKGQEEHRFGPEDEVNRARRNPVSQVEVLDENVSGSAGCKLEGLGNVALNRCDARALFGYERTKPPYAVDQSSGEEQDGKRGGNECSPELR